MSSPEGSNGGPYDPLSKITRLYGKSTRIEVKVQPRPKIRSDKPTMRGLGGVVSPSSPASQEEIDRSVAAAQQQALRAVQPSDENPFQEETPGGASAWTEAPQVPTDPREQLLQTLPILIDSLRSGNVRDDLTTQLHEIVQKVGRDDLALALQQFRDQEGLRSKDFGRLLNFFEDFPDMTGMKYKFFEAAMMSPESEETPAGVRTYFSRRMAHVVAAASVALGAASVGAYYFVNGGEEPDPVTVPMKDRKNLAISGSEKPTSTLKGAKIQPSPSVETTESSIPDSEASSRVGIVTPTSTPTTSAEAPIPSKLPKPPKLKASSDIVDPWKD